MKKYLLLTLLTLCTLPSMAQKLTITGTILDGEMEGEPLPGAAVVLLNTKDSTQVTGVVAQVDGQFSLPVSKAGTYLLRMSFMGYLTQYRNITINKKNSPMELGKVIMDVDAKQMKEAVVTEQLAQVEVVADTFMYNADAYKLPEGSTLEALIRKLPGAEIDDDGNLKINGKSVSKILVKGKEFFGNDKEMALKNLPTKMINKIKAYDKKSDYSRITGIDDGEEETVLDLTVKRGMGEGWMVNVDVAVGDARKDEMPGRGNTIDFPRPLYTGNINVSRFTDNLQFMIIASRNNINNGSGRWGGFGGGSGATTTTMSGLNVTWTNGLKREDAKYLEIGGNVRYNSREAEGLSLSNSETFLGTTSSSFSNSRRWSNNKSWNVNADMRLEWKPDSMTTLIMRPSYSHSQNENKSDNKSVTFNDNPYAKTDNPLEDYTTDALFVSQETYIDGDGNEQTRDKDIRTNSNESESKSNGRSDNGSINLQLNRRLEKPGRNVTLDVNGNINKSDNHSLSWSDITYYQKPIGAPDRRKLQDRYTASPSKNWSVQSRASYTEPLTQNLNLQISYQYQRRFNDTKRSMFDLDKLVGIALSDNGLNYALNNVGGYDGNPLIYEAILQQLYADGMRVDDIYPFVTLGPSELDDKIKDQMNSQYATYKENNHNAQVMFRYTKKFENEQELRFNLGMNYQPQVTLMHYQKGAVDTTVTRFVNNWAPRINMRWKISKVSQFRINYNPRMNQPSMTQLMEVTDDSNPLNISTGNAGLRSSWNNNMYVEYNGYRDSTRASSFFNQSSWYLRAGYGNTRNSITSATIYDSETGGRYVRPMNINGNWNSWGNININTALGKKKYWNFSNNTNVNYNYRLGYLSSKEKGVVITPDMYDASGRINMDKLFSSVDLSQFESATKTMGVGDWMRLNYRKTFGDNWSIDLGANAGFNYNHTTSTARTGNNINSWTFNYGGNANIMFPWNVTLNTTITQQSRRGYADKNMNTNELLWNATLQKSFLKGKAATISIEWNDILHQRSNVSRAISEFARTDTYNNNINSYFMVHFIYKLNLMGNREARSAMRGNDAPAGRPEGGRPAGGRPEGGRPGRM